MLYGTQIKSHVQMEFSPLLTPQRACCHTGLLRDAACLNNNQLGDPLLLTPQRAWCHTGLLREAVSSSQRPSV